MRNQKTSRIVDGQKERVLADGYRFDRLSGKRLAASATAVGIGVVDLETAPV